MQTSFLSKAVLIAASLTAASPALATDFDAISIGVATHDLDLGKESHVARLETRLNRAAEAACAPGDTMGVAGRRAFNACKADALEAARVQMERVTVSVAGGDETLLASRR